MATRESIAASDIDSRWQRVLRSREKKPVSLSCPYCPDRPVFLEEPKLFLHVQSRHPDVLAGVADEAVWRRDLANRASQAAPGRSRATKGEQHGDSSPAWVNSAAGSTFQQSPGPDDLDGTTQQPLIQPKTLPEMKHLSLGHNVDRDHSMPDATGSDSAPSPSTSLQRKRPAGELTRPDPLYNVHSPNRESRTGYRAHARTSGVLSETGVAGLKEPSSILDSTQPDAIAESGRNSVVLAPRKRLFNPDVDNPITRSSFEPSSITNERAPARTYDSRAHVLRSRNKPQRRRERIPRESGPQISPRGSHPANPTSLISDAVTSRRISEPPMPSEAESDLVVNGFEMERQPRTRPISPNQLTIEVRGIYAGLVMVEARCIEVDKKQAEAARAGDQATKLNNDQWRALIALHRTLLHEHHDFFLASQHPSASPALRKLASKYSMPARMWRHGIHSFLELLRRRLPGSLEHMLTFIYLAYSMMALLFETVSAFEGTWIECLGDLARYRMAVEDDEPDRDVWTGVARYWYTRATDKSNTTGRLYHHLAILARRDTLQQLSCYSKSLSVLHPFLSARESISTIFEPVLTSTPKNNKPLAADIAVVRVHALLFTGAEPETIYSALVDFLMLIDLFIARATSEWKEMGVFVAIANITSMMNYGHEDNELGIALRATQGVTAPVEVKSDDGVVKEIAGPSPPASENALTADQKDDDSKAMVVTTTSLDRERLLTGETKNTVSTFAPMARSLTMETFHLTLQHIGDPNILPHVHVTLVFLLHVAKSEATIKLLGADACEPSGEDALKMNQAESFPKEIEGAAEEKNLDVSRTTEMIDSAEEEKSAVRIAKSMDGVQPRPREEMSRVPWDSLAALLNTIKIDTASYSVIEGAEFPKGQGRPLREDFHLSGLIWSAGYFPEDWFTKVVVDYEERSHELPSMDPSRRERILWCAFHIAQSSLPLRYDQSTKKFAAS